MTAARETGVVVGVGHNDHRHDPLWQLVKDTVESGRIGKLAAVEANTSHSGGLCGPADQWRFDPERNPGGMLFQCGVHSLHELMYLFGPVREVAAMFRYDVHPIRTAQVAQTLLRFDSGLVGSLNAYHVTAYNHRIRLFGTKGNLYIDTHVRRATFQERKQGEPEPAGEVPIPPSKNEKEHSCGNVMSFADAIHGKIKTPGPACSKARGPWPSCSRATGPERRSEPWRWNCRAERRPASSTGYRVSSIQYRPSGTPHHARGPVHATASYRGGADQRQGVPALGEPGGMHRQIRSAAEVGVELILFAESVVQSYDLSPENLALAEPLTGPLCRQLAAWAAQYPMVICAGFYERDADRLYNSCVVVTPGGEVRSQRKHSLTPGEIEAHISPGPRERTVFEFNGIRMGILVCADTGIEGLSDLLRQQKIEYKLIPTAGGGKLADMLHESDLASPDVRKTYEENRPRVFNTKAIMSEEDCPVCGFAAANALGYDGKNACHQGHCMIVDNNRIMRAHIPGTIVLEHQQDQMAHAALSF